MNRLVPLLLILAACDQELVTYTDTVIDFTEKDVAAFWSRVRRGEGCWLWLGSINSTGYGRLYIRGLRLGAHRWAYIFTHGAIPSSLEILHKCDNPPCVNPDHLIAGTPLRANDVRKIRLLHDCGGFTMTELGKHFGVTTRAISRIILRTRWGHVQ